MLSLAARSTTSGSGILPVEKMTARSPAWLATATTFRCTCTVINTPPSGAFASTSLNRSEA